ncbi:MAG: maltose alpha-D-glucosyltransferase [Chlamydiales bacterium]|nr:maltose alpha-D-glucosyltransferase [Chlamydiia bacterium]MCP5506825.1 maltose alpha-D-glucosyltransferase [Chlamydiales bacterium]
MSDQLWYKDAVFYQLHVKCFKDGNSDGIGDFKGLKEKLGYIQDLGATAIWLQPFYPSPLLDDGYDIADYFDVHPDYGTLADFKSFLKAAHSRGIKVVTELVINHTSDQHKWFQKSRRAAPGTKWRDYYMWSDDPQKYSEARIIFKDFEHSNWAWDPVAKAYYWHRFYSHQPDLNYDSPHLQKEIFKILDFWMQMGVDGMRLDAIPYLYAREGTDCENLPETHAFLAQLRSHVDKNFPNRMLLAEANQWPEQAAKYFGEGKECHMAFHFPVMPRLFMALRLEDRFPIIDILEQTPPIPKESQWAIFLRNHDELTLEMVTDEERDFMYRSYAKDPKARINLGIRRRLAPLLDNDRAKIELMNALLQSLPGSPIIYYGDEIGMGDNYYLGDRNGVRTPMQWNNDRNAGFSSANPQQLYLPLIIEPQYHHAHLNVENQENAINSQLWWMRRILRVRQNYQAFGRGDITFLYTPNQKILAFIRKYEDQAILVVVNLSRFSQYFELNLKDYVGCVPRDLFSMNTFAPVSHEHSYGLTIGGYHYYWLLLEKNEDYVQRDDTSSIDIGTEDSWENLLSKDHAKHGRFVRYLSKYLMKARWFRSKDNKVKDIVIFERVHLNGETLLFLQVTYVDDDSEIYLLPLTYLPYQEAADIVSRQPNAAVMTVKTGESEGYLLDATYCQHFQRNLLEAFLKRKKIQGRHGKLIFTSNRIIQTLLDGETNADSYLLKVEQSNSSVIYGDKLFLKLFRHLEEGVNPDIELVKYLSEVKTPSVPPLAASVEWQGDRRERIGIGIMQQFIANSGDMWQHTLNVIRIYHDNLISKNLSSDDLFALRSDDIFDLTDLPEEIKGLIGIDYLETIADLAYATAEVHTALANSSDSNIGAETFTPFSQKAKYQWMRTRLKRVVAMIHDGYKEFDTETRQLAEQFLSFEGKIIDTFKIFIDGNLKMMKTRIHGDLHLGQVLYTTRGPMIIDFEGEPAVPLSERRLKRLVLQDVASMIRSFDYAVQSKLVLDDHISQDKRDHYEHYAAMWYSAVASKYLKTYLRAIQMSDHPLVPESMDMTRKLLKAFLMHKAVYEIGYELQNRPSWVKIPLKGILNLVIGE